MREQDTEADRLREAREQSRGGRGGAKAKPGKERKAADILIELSTRAEELFHAPDGTGFATILVDDHLETWPIRNKGFRRWLARAFFDETTSAPNSDAIQSALNVIEARAHFDGPEKAVYIRVGAHDGRLYLDLADARWRAVEVDSDGWRVIDRPPIPFRRAAGMLALPEPTHGGSIEGLRPFLNIEDNKDFVLAVTFILAALRDRGPYPVLCLAGEHGSAKSTFTAVLRKLIDPNSAPLRALSREDRDLFIAANNAHLLAFDNISTLPDWISDTLCRLATGGGFATRQLYSDQDEALFDAMRPIILNGIEDIVGRPDLADRSIFLTLRNITENKRKSERDFWDDFKRAHPHILGALLDGVAHGLRQLPHTRLAKTPRMADFALWSAACETAFWKSGIFAEAYGHNREQAVVTVIEADLVATSVQSFMAARTEWTGTSADLLGALKMAVGEDQTKLKEWPATPRALSGRLRRAAATLRKIGIEITFDRTPGGSSGGKRTRKIIIARTDGGNDRPHRPHRPYAQEINEMEGDGTGDGRDDAEATVPPTVPANLLKSKARDGGDDRDAKFPTQTGNVPLPITAEEIDELKRRGFSGNDLFGMNPERARAILADPRYERMGERFRVGEKTAEPCHVCLERGAKMITCIASGETVALHLKHAPIYEEASGAAATLRSSEGFDYVGPVVSVPDQGPDPLDEYGEPVATTGGGLSEDQRRQLAVRHARWLAEGIPPDEVDAATRFDIRELVDDMTQVEAEFEQVRQIAFAV